MSGTAQAPKNCITLTGSAQIISEYLRYGINSILFQRGIYPPETFTNTQHYGVPLLISTDPKIEAFLNTVLTQAGEWLSKNLINKISMVITNAHTKEVLECWDFKIQAQLGDVETDDPLSRSSSKDLKRIQQEIRDVMRQISATVTFLPLLDCICTFDVMIHTVNSCDIPESWDETGVVFIQNSQAVPLKSFSTGLHNVQTVVNYKMT